MPKKEKERSLPQPPRKKTRPGFHEQPEREGLVFDKLQEAMAEGKVEEFMKENMPEGEYARKLAGLMMGMSGVPFAERPAGPASGPSQEMKADETERPMLQVPEDVLQAALAGNVSTLAGLLGREHGKKQKPQPGKKKEKGGAAYSESRAEGQPEKKEELAERNGSLLEKEIVDSLLEISVDNNLAMDWLIYRALKLYIKKYRETGQL